MASTVKEYYIGGLPIVHNTDGSILYLSDGKTPRRAASRRERGRNRSGALFISLPCFLLAQFLERFRQRALLGIDTTDPNSTIFYVDPSALIDPPGNPGGRSISGGTAISNLNNLSGYVPSKTSANPTTGVADLASYNSTVDASGVTGVVVFDTPSVTNLQ